MRKIKLLTYFLTLAILIIGCGKYDRIDDGGFTEVTFTRPNGNAIKTTLDGNVLIYAQSGTYATNLKLGTYTDTARITLPNGYYAFLAIGYESNTNDLSGVTRCGKAGVGTRIQLNGTPITVPLDLTAANCNDGIFLDSTTDYYETGNTSFNRIEVVHCGSNAGTALNGFTGTDNCVSAIQWPSALRFQLIAPIFKRDMNGYSRLADAIVSPCTVASSSGLAATSNIRFPIGTAQAGYIDVLALEVETFSSTDCLSGSLGRHKFSRGMIFGADSSNLGKVTFNNTTGTNVTRLFVRQP